MSFRLKKSQAEALRVYKKMFGDMAQSQQETEDQAANELAAKMEQSVAQADLLKQQNKMADKLGVTAGDIATQTQNAVQGDTTSPMNPANSNVVGSANNATNAEN